MKKKKGFTLIELLAVIVILAIIALIATPIVMNVIENSKKGAAERTAENFLKAAETAVATERLDNEILSGEYDIQEDGNLCKSGTTCTDETEIKIDMNGNKPKSGTINIINGVVSISTSMVVGDYTVRYDDTKNAYVASKGTNDSYICEKTGEASKTVGAEYTCHLDTDRTFYVLENIESSENISLIMDRNFTDGTVPTTLAWCIDGGNNNTTCQNINSKEKGTPLKHIQDTFGSKVEVSFPTRNQIITANNGSSSKLPQWLYDYLNPGSGVIGYWTASYDASGTLYTWIVYGHGVNVNSNYNVTATDAIGVRPVITIPKDEL